MEDVPSSPGHTSNVSKGLILFLVIIGFITAFAGGYFLNNLLRMEQPPPVGQVDASPVPSGVKIQNTPDGFQEVNSFAPGKAYFEDTIIMMAKEAPHIALVATVTRQEQDNGYLQNARVSFFDGNSWQRKIVADNTTDANIKTNELVRNWKMAIDQSRVLKESISGYIDFEGHTIQFASGVLQNEISMRSLPGYTKLMSNSQGSLIVDGKKYEAYEVATKIYSLNSAEIQFYDQPIGVTTDWVAFWDLEGNFYHVDATEVANPTEFYQPHKIAIFEDANATVAKTFQMSVTRDSQVPPNSYKINLESPIGVVLDLNILNSINKAPGGGYIWYMSQIAGTVSKAGKIIEGIGLVEYIND